MVICFSYCFAQEALQRLDQLIFEISQRGMRATLVLCNYWQAPHTLQLTHSLLFLFFHSLPDSLMKAMIRRGHFGGAQKYVGWARQRGENVWQQQDFFTNQATRQW